MKYPFSSDATPRLIIFLKKNNLNIYEYEILDQIGKCSHMSEAFLIKRCVSSFRVTYKDEHVSEVHIQKSLNALMKRGLLQKIDSKVLEVIVSMVPKNDITPEPVNGFPCVGDIDFTQEGAYFFLEMERCVFYPKETDNWYAAELEAQEGHIQILATTKTAADNFLADIMPQGSIIRKSKLEKVGPWVTRWWRTFPNGWRLEVEIEGGQERE